MRIQQYSIFCVGDGYMGIHTIITHLALLLNSSECMVYCPI